MKKIVLDVDGVLLDYNKKYRDIYYKVFGILGENKEPNAYDAYFQYGLPKITGEDWSKFSDEFSHQADKLEALDGTVESVKQLKDMGFSIHIVSAIDHALLEKRITNLVNIYGNVFDEIICCGLPYKIPDLSQMKLAVKKAHLERINGDYFVDDLVTNFYNLSDLQTKFVLVDKNGPDSPNKEPLIKPYSVHPNLKDFVNKLYNFS